MQLEYVLKPVDMLMKLVGIKSYNGGEEKVIDEVKKVLETHDIYDIKIVEDAEGKPNLVADIGGEKPVISLVSHADTVPIGDENKWSYNPLGESNNGLIYGRGAFDNKGQLVSQLYSFIKLREHGVRGLKLIIFSDEERQSKSTGARWITKEKWGLVKCDYALGEGGVTVEVNGKKILLVSFGERGGAEFYVKIKGSGGHSSLLESASHDLKKVLLNLLISNPLIRNDSGREAIKYMKKNFPFNGLVKRIIFMSPAFREIFKSLRNIQINISKAHLHGNGKYLNMMPTKLELWVNMRLVPELSEEEARKILEEHLGTMAQQVDSNIEVETLAYIPSKSSPLETHFIKFLRNNITKYGFDTVAPILIPASTDLTWFREKGVPSYGFFPSLVDTVAMAKSSHKINEYISEKALTTSIDATVKIIKDFKG